MLAVVAGPKFSADICYELCRQQCSFALHMSTRFKYLCFEQEIIDIPILHSYDSIEGGLALLAPLVRNSLI